MARHSSGPEDGSKFETWAWIVTGALIAICIFSVFFTAYVYFHSST